MAISEAPVKPLARPLSIHGRWQDKIIIDADFVRDAWRPSRAASHYGLFWWRWTQDDPRIGPVHFADGVKGQRIFVLPKHGIIIAMIPSRLSYSGLAALNL